MTFPKVLIVGSSGQVARSLVACAPNDRMKIAALGRPQLDLTDPTSVETVMMAMRPDLVINAAAYTAVDTAEKEKAAAFALNATGAAFLSEASTMVCAPIIHLSTDYVFNGQKLSPYVESDAVDPIGAYGRSKLAGELAVAATNPRHLILRTAWVYSHYENNFLSKMLRAAEAEEEISVVHDQIGNPTSAADLAEAIWKLASCILSQPASKTTGVYNLVARGEATWAEFAEEIFRVSAEMKGPSARVRRISAIDYPAAARRPPNSRLDGTKLSRDFDITLPCWQASLRRCVGELIQSRSPAS